MMSRGPIYAIAEMTYPIVAPLIGCMFRLLRRGELEKYDSDNGTPLHEYREDDNGCPLTGVISEKEFARRMRKKRID